MLHADHDSECYYSSAIKYSSSSISNKATIFVKKCGHIREVAFGEREK